MCRHGCENDLSSRNENEKIEWNKKNDDAVNTFLVGV